MNRKRIKVFKEVADLQLKSFSQSKNRLKQALNSKDEVEQWWGLTTCAAFGKEAAELKSRAQQLLASERSFIRARALVFLARTGERFADNDIYSILKNTKTIAESLLVLNDFTYLVENGLLAPFKLDKTDMPETNEGIEWRITYLNNLYSEHR